jgi:pyruvate dehydrogenase E1 component alpha subunit
MHIADFSHGNLGATGVVGGGIPIAVGIGLALKMKKSPNILLSFFGEGSTNEGSFHEALNMASLWDLPIVFICDNNHYSMSMAMTRSMKIEFVSSRAASYGMPGVSTDGNQVLGVYQVVSEAVERARSGEGPTLIENITYRWRGHSKSDRNLYRTKEEIAEWMERCPINSFKELLIESKVMTHDEVDQIDRKAKEAIDLAAEEAITLPEPSPENMEDEVYAQ